MDLVLRSLIVLLMVYSAPAWGAYSLTYNAENGSLIIDTKGGPIGGYVLELDSSADIFVGPFVVVTDPPANPINLTVNSNQILLYEPGGSIRTGFPWYLSEVKIPGQIAPEASGVINIGNVAKTGMSEQQYIDAFSNPTNGFHYVGGEGSGVLGEFELLYIVPEPGGLCLLATSGLVILRRRR